jgi:hypothetical protein
VPLYACGFKLSDYEGYPVALLIQFGRGKYAGLV